MTLQLLPASSACAGCGTCRTFRREGLFPHRNRPAPFASGDSRGIVKIRVPEFRALNRELQGRAPRR